MSFAKRDMLFCVLYVGDEYLIRQLVADSARRLGAEWDAGIRGAGLMRLRVMFFLLLDRDFLMKTKIFNGWPELCVPGMDGNKANSFFQNLRVQVIDPWLMDERRCEDDFVSDVVDLYLVS